MYITPEISLGVVGITVN